MKRANEQVRVLVVALVMGLTACSSGSDTPPATAPASVTSPVPATPSPEPSASATGQALSPYESDPAVGALRLQYVGLALGINRKNFHNKQLRDSSTPRRYRLLPSISREELGNYYPGPSPFAPVDVRRKSATSRAVLICVVNYGWALTKKGGRPAAKREIAAGEATVVKVKGKWLVSTIYQRHFSCRGTTIREARWS